jgi:hypothetical protein
MIKRHLFLLMLCAMVVFSLAAVTVFSQVNLNNKNNTNWKVYNGEPATSGFWDINKAQVNSLGALLVPIQPYLSETTGSFAIYLLANDNTDITGKTFTTTASWTPGEYNTRSSTYPAGAYVRFEFQDVTSGPYSMNDYWWSTGGNSLDLNALTLGTLTVPTTPADWSNLCGKLATDQTVYSGPDCLGGSYPAVSPADGFTNAMKNVKQLGLSFGNGSSYASGVAIVGTAPGIFTVSTFTVQ